MNHLKQFNSEEIKVLLTLDPQPMKYIFKAEFEKALKQFNNNQVKNNSNYIKGKVYELLGN